MIILREPGEKRDQTPEQILELLESAVETRAKTRMTVLTINEQSSTEGIVTPIEINDAHVVVETEDGFGFSIELYRIIAVEFVS